MHQNKLIYFFQIHTQVKKGKLSSLPFYLIKIKLPETFKNGVLCETITI